MLGLGAAGLAVPAALPEFLHPETDREYYHRKFQENGLGWVSYKFHYSVVLPPNHSTRIRYTGYVGPIC